MDNNNFGLMLSVIIIIALMLALFLGKNKFVVFIAYALGFLAALLYILHTVGLF